MLAIRLDCIPINNTYRFQCRPNQAGLPVTQFPIQLRWPNGNLLELELSFPCEGAGFVRGNNLLNGQTVALDRLGAITAIAQSPGPTHFWLEATINSQNVNNLLLRTRLQDHQNGQKQFALHFWQTALNEMLAMTGKLDAQACLSLKNAHGTMARLYVARYDFRFVPDYENKQLSASAMAGGFLENGWQNCITVSMIPLWNVSAEPIVLSPIESHQSQPGWQIPVDLPTEYWWVMGLDGDWARFRPMLWLNNDDENQVAANQFNAEPPSLQNAICCPSTIRPRRIAAFIKQLAKEPGHPDWRKLLDYMELTKTYPGSAFDLILGLVKNPVTLALALVRSDTQFDTVWSLAYQLPFSWHLLPVTCWHEAIVTYYKGLRESLEPIDPDDSMRASLFNILRQRLINKQKFFISILNKRLVEQLGININLPDNNEQTNITWLAFLQAKRQAMMGRHNNEEYDWILAQIPIIRGFQQTMLICLNHAYYAPIINELIFYAGLNQANGLRYVCLAPFIAAHYNLNCESCSPNMLYELRQLRNFDREWFDEAFAIALHLGLTNQGQ